MRMTKNSILLLTVCSAVLWVGCMAAAAAAAASAAEDSSLRAASWATHATYDIDAPGDADVPEWGSYRPGVYFGLKQRGGVSRENPLSGVTGLLWGSSHKVPVGLRHDTAQDELQSFEWIEHDGQAYGLQHLRDGALQLQLETSFVSSSPGGTSSSGSGSNSNSSGSGASEGNHWSQRIVVRPLLDSRAPPAPPSSTVSLIVYIGMQVPHTLQRNTAAIPDAAELAELLARSLIVDDVGVSRSTLTATGSGERTGGDFELVLTARPVAGPSGDSFRRCLRRDRDGLGAAEGEGGADDEEEEEASANCYLTASYTGLAVDANSAVQALQAAYKQGPSANAKHGRAHGRRARTRTAPLFTDEGELNGQLADMEKGDTVTLAVQVQVPAGRAAEIDITLRRKGGASASASSAVEEGEEDGNGEEGSDKQRSSGSCRALTDAEADGSALTAELELRSQAFHADFERRFGLASKEEFTAADVTAAKTALSSTLGGVGFFHGVPLLGDASEASLGSKVYAVTQPVSLLTATPSRTAFPRGFLWDEGYHQQLLLHWDPNLSMRVLKSWLQAQYQCKARPELGGWIPREMILGEEAEARVPDEFVTQRVDVANPPTLLLVVRSLLRLAQDSSNSGSDGSADEKGLWKFLQQAHKPLHQWIRWLAHSQQGAAAGSYRWRGRSQTDGKVIPNTLASGLDDYPRSAFPDETERHVDLHCWVTLAAKLMAELEEGLLLDPPSRGSLPIQGEDGQGAVEMDYADASSYLVAKMSELHWDEDLGAFADVGMIGSGGEDDLVQSLVGKCGNNKVQKTVHIPLEAVKARQEAGKQVQFSEFCPKEHPEFLYPLSDGRGGYEMVETYVADGELVSGTIRRMGYVNLFPLLLRLLPAEEGGKLGAILDTMEDPKLLWTDFGLRSISASDLFYQRRNAPGDAPYWRGPIWLPINYLAAGALHHYSQIPGPLQSRCEALYQKLRTAITQNVLKEYHRTGFFWEHYEDKSGVGSRGHPFTGWTALVVAIMAERY